MMRKALLYFIVRSVFNIFMVIKLQSIMQKIKFTNLLNDRNGFKRNFEFRGIEGTQISLKKINRVLKNITDS